jgi:hypothetical protein
MTIGAVVHFAGWSDRNQVRTASSSAGTDVLANALDASNNVVAMSH